MEKINIYEVIPRIMGELRPIGRDQTNKQQAYAYRGIDDLCNALAPLLTQFGVFAVPQVLKSERSERQSKSGGTLVWSVLTVKYTFYAKDGSSVEAITVGEGMDSGDKASNKAMSIAYKYALTQVFTVRTKDEIDPDSESHELASHNAAPRLVATPEQQKIVQTVRQNLQNVPKPASAALVPPKTDGSYVIQFSRHKGKTLYDLGPDNVLSFMNWLTQNANKEGKELSGPAKEFVREAQAYLHAGMDPSFSEPNESQNLDDIPF